FTAFAMVAVALMFDGFQILCDLTILIPVIGFIIAWLIGLVITILAFIVFWIWGKLVNTNLLDSALKYGLVKIILFVGPYILDGIFNAIPGITLSTVATIIVVWLEDRSLNKEQQETLLEGYKAYRERGGVRGVTAAAEVLGQKYAASRRLR